MTTSQIIMVAIVYALLLVIIGQLIYACVFCVLDDIKEHDYELTAFTVTMFGYMVVGLVVIGLLPISH